MTVSGPCTVADMAKGKSRSGDRAPVDGTDNDELGGLACASTTHDDRPSLHPTSTASGSLSGAHRPLLAGFEYAPQGLWLDWILERGWTAQAACQGHATGGFFPGRGDSLRIDAARSVCAHCPVRIECGEYAILRGEPGIWGGLTERDRRRISRARRGR